MTMFRLKINYVGTADSGEMEKKKVEILTECVNYSDAETTLFGLVNAYEMNKYEEISYEIVKCKFTHNDIYCNNLVKIDDKNQHINGLKECFFEDEQHNLYAVDVIAYGDKVAKEKDIKETLYIPATDPADATHKAKSIILWRYNNMRDFCIKNVKTDPAYTMYLMPVSYETLQERNNTITEYGL